jgi:nucleotide-binding universal stress UspA family protein
MTNNNPALRRVVAGVDASEHAARAAEWAAREARDRGLPLHLVHALDLPDPAHDVRGYSAFTAARREDGARLLAELAERLGGRFPGLPVSVELSEFTAPQTLVTLSSDSDLVVTGTRGHGGFAGLLLGSVSLKLAAHSHGPVVVVHGGQTAEPVDDIVLGVEPDQAEAPIRFAFATAATLGATVHAVRTWWPGTAYAAYGYAVDTENTEREQAEQVTALLAPIRKAYPDVKVSVDVARGNAVPLLIEAARGARLLVIGAHRRRSPLSVGAGYVVQGLLSHSTTPVAVVPIA